METFSPEVERHVLAGIIKYPEIFPDISVAITDKDFYLKVNQTIFCVVRNQILSQKEVDAVVIGQEIKNMGIAFEDDIDIFDYLETISLIQINKKAVKNSALELKKLTIARELIITGKTLVKEIKESISKSPQELIAMADKIYNERILTYQLAEHPQNIYDTLESLVEERGNNPIDEVGLTTPYSEFNHWFGGLRNGNIYAVVSRPKHGKSTFLMDMCRKLPIVNKFKVPCLYLDTEMSTQEQQLRLASSLSGINEWYLATGQWRKNPEMVEKVRTALRLIRSNEFSLKHVNVAGKPIEEVLSIIRRWYYTEVGRGGVGVACYDYIKLTGEKVAKEWQEYQVIGDKINRLKEITIELNIPLITACQLNRSAESGTDDSSAIAMSDRLQWFASFVGIFRRKSLEEIAADGESCGTHILKPTAYRFQGKEATGHLDVVRIELPDKKVVYKPNYINYNVSNFNVQECGTLRQMVNSGKIKIKIGEKPEDEHRI